MDQSELKYAIRVDEQAFFIRFYCWLYQADKEKVNFCKLFWAYVFAAPALFLRGGLELACLTWEGLVLMGKGLLWVLSVLLIPFFALLDLSSEHRDKRLARMEAEREAEEAERAKEKLNPKEPKPPSEIMSRSLGFVEHGGTLAIMKCKTFIESTRTARVAAGRTTVRAFNHVGEVTSMPGVGRAILAFATCVSIAIIGGVVLLTLPTLVFLFSGAGHGLAAAAAGTGEGVSAATYAVTHSEISLWALLGLLGAVTLITAAMGAVAIGLPFLFVKYFWNPITYPISRAGVGGGRVIGGGFRGFAQVMYLGYYAVKTSTCPRIEIEPRPDHEKIERLEKEVELV